MSEKCQTRTSSLNRRKIQAKTSSPTFNLERYQPGEQGCGIELTDYRFQIAKAACHRMQRIDIAVAG